MTKPSISRRYAVLTDDCHGSQRGVVVKARTPQGSIVQADHAFKDRYSDMRQMSYIVIPMVNELYITKTGTVQED